MRRRAERKQGVERPKVREGGRLRPGPIGAEVVKRGASHVRGRQERAAPDCFGGVPMFFGKLITLGKGIFLEPP